MYYQERELRNLEEMFGTHTLYEAHILLKRLEKYLHGRSFIKYKDDDCYYSVRWEGNKRIYKYTCGNAVVEMVETYLNPPLFDRVQKRVIIHPVDITEAVNLYRALRTLTTSFKLN